jgi:predicted permease
MQNLLQDLRFGARLLLRNPLFTAIAVLSLALGIGVNTTIFSVFNTIFLGSLPVKDPGRLVSIFTTDAKNKGQFLNFMQVSYPNFEDYRDQNGVFTGLVAQIFTPLSLSTGEAPERVIAQAVSGNYFEVLGVKPAHGRTFLPEEDTGEGKYPVVVLSYGLWQRRFGANPDVVGSDIILNGQDYTIIGILKEGFRGTNVMGGADLYVPMAMHEQVLTDFNLQQFHHRRGLLFTIFGRLKPGVSLSQASADMKMIASKLEKAYKKDNDGRSVALLPLLDTLIDPNIRQQALLAARMMMGVVGMVLLIACANVANLLLARASIRCREIAVRLSLGASRVRLVRQLLTESFLMAAIAGLLGLLLAMWGRDLLWLMRPPFVDDNTLQVSIDGKVLLFTAALSILTGVLFGLVPALRATRMDLIWALKDRTGRPARADRRFHIRNVLVVIQVALSLIALVAAGLFLRSLHHAQRIDPGFERQNLLMVSFDLGGQKYDTARGLDYYRRVVSRVEELPQVKGASIASAPLFNGDVLRTVFAEGQDMSDKRNGKLTPLLRVWPGYFDTVRMPILRGRAFSEHDREGSPMVAVINETMAKRQWPGEEPIGKRFRCIGETWVIEVVGIVHDAKYQTLGEEPTPFMYFPLLQHYTPNGTLHVLTEGDPAKLRRVILDQVQALDKSMPLVQVMTVGQAMETVLWAPRMGATLLAAFGVLALLLAAIGIHGVVSYSVAQRTQEIGIRMALGAQPKDVLKLVMGQTGRIVLLGGVTGLAGAYAISKILETLLYDVSGGDPASFAGTTAILVAAALLASYLPARHATRVDPVVTLKCE